MKNLNQRLLKLLMFALLVSFTAVSCDDDDNDDGPGEEELITEVTLRLTGTAGPGNGDVATATATDADGDGRDITYTTLTLTAGTTYSGTITFTDTINNEDITEEIGEEEPEEHRVDYAFTISGAASDRIAITVTDTDSNSLPVGIEYTAAVTDGAAATGVLSVILYHFDDAPKGATNVSDEIDVDLSFPVSIQAAAASVVADL